ncbi:MAG: hypothetical protein EBZ48_07200 [Proteobacteria bacterium]|nr:hypothetical protein [Pseudomonadota bacterium]
MLPAQPANSTHTNDPLACPKEAHEAFAIRYTKLIIQETKLTRRGNEESHLKANSVDPSMPFLVRVIAFLKGLPT